MVTRKIVIPHQKGVGQIQYSDFCFLSSDSKNMQMRTCCDERSTASMSAIKPISIQPMIDMVK